MKDLATCLPSRYGKQSVATDSTVTLTCPRVWRGEGAGKRAKGRSRRRIGARLGQQLGKAEGDIIGFSVLPGLLVLLMRSEMII